MDIYSFNPLQDNRWSTFIKNHRKACVFHSVEWLSLLEQAYGYEPVAYTTTRPGEQLSNALLFCRVRSWLTGQRLVSLPFSDHCEPLVVDESELKTLLDTPLEEQKIGNWKYIELRPTTTSYGDGVEKHTEEYVLHRLDLRPELKDVYSRFHVNSIRRKIERAQKTGLTLEIGRSPKLLREFYQLHVMTRRRQHLPPHPRFWFNHMLSCLGEMLTIYVARKSECPVAALLTLSSKTSFIYKYGCSNARFHNLGGMPFLFWNMIQSAKRSGHTEIDLGRSDLANGGLITFKDRWGTARNRLVYVRYPPRTGRTDQQKFSMRIARKLFGLCPTSVLTVAGNFLYRHIG